MRVAVLGAGPTGVYAAKRLVERHHDVVVYEAAGAVGGMAGSFEVAGQRVDFGSHRLHVATPESLLTELRALLGDELQERRRNGRIDLLGRWIGFPLNVSDLVRNAPPRFALRSALDAVTSPLRRPDESSFAAAIRSGLGPAVAESFYDPYARKLYGVEPTDLTAELARRRVSASSPLAIARRLASAARSGPATFLYPRRGYGAIVERLAEAAVDAGVDVRLDHPVESVTPSTNDVAVAARGAVERFDHVVSTIPVPRLAHCLPDDMVGDEVGSALRTLRTRAMVLVYLVVPTPQYTAFDAHYLPGAGQRVARLSEPKNYRSGPDPADRTVLCAELPCWQTDALWRMDDEALGDLVRDELVQLGLPDPAHIHVETRRLSSVYPVYEHRAQPARLLLDQWTAGLPRVVATGRQGHSVFDNLHHVLAMGDAVARAFTADRFDHTHWSASVESFTRHVVED